MSDIAKSSKLENSIETMYSRLPSDIRSRIIKAADQMLDIGNADTWRGQHITDWSLRAAHIYRMIGLSEEELMQKINSRLDSFFAVGRASGLSAPIANILSAPKTLDIKLNCGFGQKYDLDRYSKIKLLLGSFPNEEKTYYTISLDAACSLASFIGNDERAFEAFVHMVRLSNFDAAYNTAEALGDDRGLLTLGKFALSEFFRTYHVNDLWNAIESVKRVQGGMKPEAEEMLYDLAMEITSPDFISNVERHAEELHAYALKCLRSTGKLLRKKPIDSIKVDFITEVTDERCVAAIRDISRVIMGDSRQDLDEVRLSLESIGDVDALNVYGEKIFRQRFDPQGYSASRFYSYAIDFFRSAGNMEGMKRVMEAELSEGLVDVDDIDYEIHLIPLALEIGDVALLQKTIEGNNRLQHIARKVIQSGKQVELQADMQIVIAPYLRTALDEERKYRKILDETRAKLTSESQQKHIKLGYELLEKGDAWNAYIHFKDALCRKGLIEAGDMLLGQKKGLNAVTPYLFASLLPEDDSRLNLRIERKLLD